MFVIFNSCLPRDITHSNTFERCGNQGHGHRDAALAQVELTMLVSSTVMFTTSWSIIKASLRGTGCECKSSPLAGVGGRPSLEPLSDMTHSTCLMSSMVFKSGQEGHSMQSSRPEKASAHIPDRQDAAHCQDGVLLPSQEG